MFQTTELQPFDFGTLSQVETFGGARPVTRRRAGGCECVRDGFCCAYCCRCRCSCCWCNYYYYYYYYY